MEQPPDQTSSSGSSRCNVETAPRCEEENYNSYLLAIALLSFIGGFIAILELYLAFTSEAFPVSSLQQPTHLPLLLQYPSLVVVTMAISFLFAAYCTRSHHVNVMEFPPEQGGAMTLRAKKSALIISFTLFIVGLAILISWTGGSKGSIYASFLPLAGCLGVYIARKVWSRIFNGTLTVLFYILCSKFYFDRTIEEVVAPKFHWYFVVEIATISVVILLSGMLSAQTRVEPKARSL